jgi:glutamyl-tRNA synthetase
MPPPTSSATDPGYRGRFAPSPTGDLHLGSVATALVAWLTARARRGILVLRVEDLDGPRVVAGAEARQIDDLRWLGLDWDEGPDAGGPYGPYRQSERGARYEAALARLDAAGLVYRCDCSRAEIARIASAPHPGDEGPRYPGTCRPHGMAARAWRRPPAVRLAVPDRVVTVADALQGSRAQNVWRDVGDFVLRRGDGVWAYQLAVVVDDLAMRVTEVVRGADLLGSAPRQALLAELLGGTAPVFAHVPLLVAADGARLAKRARGTAVRDHRVAGRRPAEVVGLVAHALGLTASPAAVTPRELLDGFDRTPLAARLEARLSPAAAPA